MSDTATQPAQTSTEAGRLHLGFLDGLRGLAALYVVVFHIWLLGRANGLPWEYAKATLGLAFGRSAVAVFIVLSGFCLMMPVARSSDGRLRGGTLLYLKRRARRLLPPYYAALAVSMLAILAMPGLESNRALWYHHVTPAFTPGSILSHLLLVHNFHAEWTFTINGALWSVAAEWQIYFIFPLLLLPVWNRWGLSGLLAAGFITGLAPYYLIKNLTVTSWFIGLFTMGMAGAVVQFHPTRYQRLRSRVPWGSGAVLCAGIYFAFMAWLLLSRQEDRWFGWMGDWRVDTLVGVGTTCLLLFCARPASSTGEVRPFILKVLEHPACILLGTFSYSLYLVHEPVLGLLEYYLFPLQLPPTSMFLIVLGLGTPAAVLVAYAFHLLVEKRFMSPGASVAATARAAIASPAP
jgi:peptidoglycan/LPS O-acetylase OafA/YrhL